MTVSSNWRSVIAVSVLNGASSRESLRSFTGQAIRSFTTRKEAVSDCRWCGTSHARTAATLKWRARPDVEVSSRCGCRWSNLRPELHNDYCRLPIAKCQLEELKNRQSPIGNRQ